MYALPKVVAPFVARQPTVKIAVLVSGSGTNLESILEAEKSGRLGEAKVVLVISSKAGVFALERARQRGIPRQVIDPKSFPTMRSFDQDLLNALQAAQTDVVCLAGFLRKLGPDVIRRFEGRILNIHPALLPKHGGAGMYGHFVHEAVIAAKETVSGCSVHLVDDEFDHGAVISQAQVPVLPHDSPQDLAVRVLEQEHILYPKTIADFCHKLKGVLK